LSEIYNDLILAQSMPSGGVAVLCAAFPNEPVSLYAGGAASFVQRGEDRRTASREQIKGAIQRGDIRLVRATDAACEGLNLQRLGAQVWSGWAAHGAARGFLSNGEGHGMSTACIPPKKEGHATQNATRFGPLERYH
jgi:hypothetical protein